jgi:hypothetical protein
LPKTDFAGSSRDHFRIARDALGIVFFCRSVLFQDKMGTHRREIESGTLVMFGRWADQLLTMLRGQLADIMFGAVFLFIGLEACSIAVIRLWSGVRVVIWLGMQSISLSGLSVA